MTLYVVGGKTVKTEACYDSNVYWNYISKFVICLPMLSDEISHILPIVSYVGQIVVEIVI